MPIPVPVLPLPLKLSSSDMLRSEEILSACVQATFCGILTPYGSLPPMQAQDVVNGPSSPIKLDTEDKQYPLRIIASSIAAVINEDPALVAGSGPVLGFPNGAFNEIGSTEAPVKTDFSRWWTSVLKTKKIMEKITLYNGTDIVSITWILYSEDGVTPRKTIIDTAVPGGRVRTYI